jgi:iron complex transport system permease protein
MTAVASVLAGYRRQSARRLTAAASLALAVVATAIIDIATGPALLSPGAVFDALIGNADPTTAAIVWSLRLPMALMAVAVGASLGISGAVMQTILNNPLASCYTLGISAAAGFGAALVIALGLGMPIDATVAVPLSAFLFAALACAAVFLIGRAAGMTPETMVLAGIALLFLFQALQSLLQYLASPEVLQAIVFWLFGSLLKATWPKTGVVALVLAVSLPILLRDAWRLTALRLGEERARGLGIEVAGLRLRAFVVISVLTAAAVSFVGTIGFVGLVAPHLARMLVGEDQRHLLPMSGLCGALLLAAASVASKTLSPGAVFPIGIVTAIFGVPFFLAVILQKRRVYW